MTRPATPRPLTVSIDDAAVTLGVSRRTIERAIAEGRIRVLRVREGGRPRVPLAEIDRLLTAARPGDQAEAREEIGDESADQATE